MKTYEKLIDQESAVTEVPACVLKERTNNIMSFFTAQKASSSSYEQIENDLRTSVLTGLKQEEIYQRQKLYGSNDFDVGEDTPLWKKYLTQFKEPMILLLLASGFVSIIMGQYDDAVSITVAVLIVVTVAFVQEYRSDKSVEAITKLVPPTCHCLRDGEWSDFLAADLVPGDIVQFKMGDRVPADVRLFEAIHLEIDESSFTGETKPSKKQIQPLHDSGTNLSEASNVALMGTLVRSGKGKGIVFGIGVHSEFGSVFQMMKEEEPPKTPLQKSMDLLGKQLSTWSILIIGLVVILGWIQNRRILDMFTIGVSLAVAAIPEGLPIVVTVTLALGVMRMARRNAIVKRLPVVETLGCATVICSDKTGTLTKNEMTVTDIVLSDNRRVKVTGTGYSGHGEILLNGNAADEMSDTLLTLLIKTGCICNNASIKAGVLFGQPTEGALIAVGLKLGLVRIHEEYERLDEIPFTSDSKWMATKCSKRWSRDESEDFFFMKGAPERVLEHCKTYYRDDTEIAITQGYIDSVLDKTKELGTQGLRVIALARGKNLESMSYLGIVGIIDPPREGVWDAIHTLLNSGVQVKMITGDARETAISIGKSVGLITNAGNVLSGEQLEAMDHYDIKKCIEKISIFYRVSPKNKLTIVKALQECNNIVGMTGDGVNDAIALKRADIGIAMGKCGTDVSKEAADMILADDDFRTIMAALAEGKGIFYNIKNFVRFQLSTSIAAISLITISTLMKLPNPLNAMQILWINIIMDGPPAQSFAEWIIQTLTGFKTLTSKFSLGVEPVDDDIMRRKPRSVRGSIINSYLILQVISSAILIVLGTLFIFWREMADNIVTPRDTTMTFTCFVFFDMFNALSCRSQKKSILQVGLFTNRMFLYAVGGSLIGQMLVIYFPPLQRVFQTEALTFFDILTLLAIASSVLLLDEIRKLILRIRKKHHPVKYRKHSDLDVV